MKSNRRASRLLIWILAAALFAGGAASAVEASSPRSERELRGLIQRAIENRHPPEGESDWWKALGPGAPKVIMGMYRETGRIYFRMRLLQALAWFDDAESVEFLKAEARASADKLIRNAAIKTVGHSQGEKELPFLQEFLKHEDPETRHAAASAVQRIAADSEMAREALGKYKRDEKAAWIVAKLDRQEEAHERAQLKVKPGPGTIEPLLEILPGTWMGQWLAPDPKGKGLRPLEAEILFQANTGRIDGRLVVGKEKEKREFLIQTEQIKGGSIQGVLVAVQPAKKPGQAEIPPEKFSFSGNWKQREGHSLLLIEVPRLAVTLAVRRVDSQ